MSWRREYIGRHEARPSAETDRAKVRESTTVRVRALHIGRHRGIQS